MLTWVNILHLHQPPYQDEAVLKNIASESYQRIISLLARYPALKLTLDISGSLIECLKHSGLGSILADIHAYARAGRVELMGTALHHPILPLLPEREAERQIQLYLELFARTFPGVPQPKGFFLPEMAYAKTVADIVAKKGFQWIVLDEIHAGRTVDPVVRYAVKDSSLCVLFRNRKISNHFPPEAIFTHGDFTRTDSVLITAHDGELYGHRHRDDNGFYDKAFSEPAITFVLASDYLRTRQTQETIEPKEISWETTPEDEADGALYPLWQHPANGIQERMWTLAHLCIRAVRARESDPCFAQAENMLDRGLTSCSWWWMSGRKPTPFSPVSWHPSHTRKGLDELIGSIRLLATLPPEIKRDAEDLYANLLSRIAEAHANMQGQ